MASVNFEKFKSVQSAKAQFRHCDKDARKETDHGNKEIDLQKSDMNIQYASSSYESTCKRYDSRIKAIDEGGRNKNRRKDRVTLLGLEVPVPKDLPSSDYVKWFSRVNSIIEGRYGADNVMNAYIHFAVLLYEKKTAAGISEKRSHRLRTLPAALRSEVHAQKPAW